MTTENVSLEICFEIERVCYNYFFKCQISTTTGNSGTSASYITYFHLPVPFQDQYIMMHSGVKSRTLPFFSCVFFLSDRNALTLPVGKNALKSHILIGQ